MKDLLKLYHEQIMSELTREVEEEIVKKQQIAKYLLENDDILINIVRKLNDFDDCLGDLKFEKNKEENIDKYFKTAYEFAKAIRNHFYDINEEYFIIFNENEVGSFTKEELINGIRSELSRVIEALIKKKDFIYIDDERLKELL